MNPSLWTRLGAAIIRRMPVGRYRLMSGWNRRATKPFDAKLSNEIGGATFTCDLRDGTACEAYFTGKYEPQETAIVLGVLQPGNTFVDIGANWGYFTLVAASRVSNSGRVVCVEPDPRLFEMLEGNVKANQFGQVHPIRAAAGTEAGELTLTGFDPDGGNWGLSRVGSGEGFSFKARSLRIDDELDLLKIDRVDLLKMDIEGAEALALKGMSAGLKAGRYERLLVEIHPTLLPEFGSNAQAIIEEIMAAGYRAWEVKHDRESTRRAAYTRFLDPNSVLNEWKTGGEVGSWPHFLFGREKPFPG